MKLYSFLGDLSLI